MNSAEQLPIGWVLEELARARRFSGLEDLAAAVRAATGKDYTAEELGDWPRPGYGKHVDQVLHFTDEERVRQVEAWKERLYM